MSSQLINSYLNFLQSVPGQRRYKGSDGAGIDDKEIIPTRIRTGAVIDLYQLKDKVKSDSELLRNYNSLVKELNESTESEISLEVFQLYFRDRTKEFAEEYNKVDDKESEQAQNTYQKYLVANELMKIVTPLYECHLINSSKNVLPLEDSGNNKYPTNHSFFASTTQSARSSFKNLTKGISLKDLEKDLAECKGDYSKLKQGGTYSIHIANSIIRGKSTIEKAILDAEKTYRSPISIPSVPVHRVGKEANPDKEKDFEVLVVSGSGKEDGEKEALIFDTMIFSDAIKRNYGDKCKKITALYEPDKEKLTKAIEEISERLKGTNKKLYIYFSGHGSASRYQFGVEGVQNVGKQGSREFSLSLKPFGKYGLEESTLKDLYKKHLSDIETVTIVDACHSGSIVTKISNYIFRKGPLAVA